jgi:uncharacterized damage-inducible protein DinB
MHKRVLWLDHRFNFDLPTSHFPNVLERLRGTPARLEERVRGLAESTLTKRLDEHWSIQENVGHLADVETLWIRRVEEMIRGEPVLTPADMSNRRTEDAGHNRSELAELLTRFREARMHLVAELAEVDPEVLARRALHERLGVRMRLIDLASFVAEHDDHHLTTITELIEGRS